MTTPPTRMDKSDPEQGAAAKQLRRSATYAPSAKERNAMSKDEVEAWMAHYLAEQRELLANFDPDKIKRDPLLADYTGASITWKQVSFSIKVTDPADPKGKAKIDKVLLEENSGHVPAGSLVALMGPSGCGKSTLLDILAGKKTTPYTGTVMLNGHDMKKDPLVKRAIAYVGQEDVMPQHWTVREAVTFNASLKKTFPKTLNLADHIDSVLADVGLLQVAETKIGGPSVRGLSGGQRRRVTLARGVVSSPDVMFCDEPTSGLSSTDAEACVKALKILVKKLGMTIILVIHQPRIEVARLFDQLVLLTSQPGRVVYNGPWSDAPAYWAAVGYPVPDNANPADHFLDLVTPGAPGAVPDVFCEYYMREQRPRVLEAVAAAEAGKGNTPLQLLEQEREIMKQFGEMPPVRKSIYGVPFSQQLKMVFKRKVRLSLIDVEFISTVIFMQLFIGIVLGIIYVDVGSKEPKGITQLGFLFIFVNMALLVPVFSMPSIITERDIMKLECAEALYSEWSHIIATTVVNMLVLLLGFILMSVVMYACSVLPWRGFLLTFYWSFLNFLAMDALTSMCAAMAKNVEQANAIIQPMQLLVILFNGLTMTKKGAPSFLKWLLYVSPLSLAMEGIADDLYGDDQVIYAQLQDLYGYDRANVPLGTAICVAIAILGRAGQMYALKSMNKIQK